MVEGNFLQEFKFPPSIGFDMANQMPLKMHRRYLAHGEVYFKKNSPTKTSSIGQKVASQNSLHFYFCIF